MQEILISIRSEGSGPAASVSRGDDVFLSSHPLPDFGPEEAAALRWLLEDSPRLSGESTRAAIIGAETRLVYFGDQLFESLQGPLESARGNHALDDIALSILDPDGLTGRILSGRRQCNSSSPGC